MKKVLLTSLSALLLAGCADNEFLGSEEAQHTINGDKPILFTSQSAPMTRGEITGEPAAKLLGENYVVYGTKGDAHTKVFDHYNINWYENTKGSTETNVADWEYVGQNLHPNNTLPEGAKQYIKYWDFSAPQYDFVAFSYGKANKGKKTNITIDSKTKEVPDPVLSVIDPSKLGLATTTGTPVYTVTGKVKDLVNTYVADLVTVKKADYNKTVTPRFRQMGAKVRIAIYETVAGYAVKDVKFYYSNSRNSKSVVSNTDPTPVPVLYAVKPATNKPAHLVPTKVLPNMDESASGTMQVYFPTVGSSNENNKDYNKAHVVFKKENETDVTSTLSFKPLMYYNQTKEGVLTGSYLGQTSNEATYATASNAAGAYELILPYGVGTDLKLHVDYTLESVDGSGEEIHVSSASALVPSTYTYWQPNYAYTYIFKISKNGNGTTGNPGGSNPIDPDDPSTNPDDPNNPGNDPTNPDDTDPGDPAGLYPITFDAYVMEFDDEHVQETITTVSTPSITTYSKGVQPTANSEYKTGNNIYVSVDGATLKNDNAKLYTATVEDDALQSIDENSVANALKNYNGVKASSATTQTVTVGSTDVSSFYTLTDEVYYKCASGSVAADGVTYYAIDAANITAYVVKDAAGKTLTVTSASGLDFKDEIAAADAPDGNAIAGKFAVFKPSATGTYVFEYKESDTKKHYKIIIVK